MPDERVQWRNRYPGYNVLSQRGHWDEATRTVVLDRIHNVPSIQYFTDAEALLLKAVCDRILPQDDREPDDRIPIVPWIDERCHSRVEDGTRFESIPPFWIAWRQALSGIDETSRALDQQPFRELSDWAKDRVLSRIARGDPPGETWKTLPAKPFFYKIMLSQILSVYYAHPTAWNEIGFGGPAYPRGYLALNFGRPEPWEVNESQ